MFPLHTKTFPADILELTRLLNGSLRQVLVAAEDPVRVLEKAYPSLEEIGIGLDGARLRPDPPPPRFAVGATSPALRLERMHIRGRGLIIGPATVDLALEARQLRFDQGKDVRDEIVLSLATAADGTIEISTAKADLEAAIAKVAKHEAGKQGVTIEEVQLSLRPRGARSLDAEVHVRARKLFLSASVKIVAKLDLDEELEAKISGLVCNGNGALGVLACNFLAPHLAKLDGQHFSLMALPLGEVRLRDVRLTVTDRLTVNAEFGV
jgi:hypothetical protein